MLTASLTTEMEEIEAQWLPDPADRAEFRFWDGSSWTPQVSSGGQIGDDPTGAATLSPAHVPLALHKTLIELSGSFLGATAFSADPGNVRIRLTWIGVRAMHPSRNNDAVFSSAWNGISDLIVEDQGAIESRVTVTRVAAVGVFALAIPKRSKYSFVTFHQSTGHEWYFQVVGFEPIALRARLKAVLSHVDLPSLRSAASAAPATADQMATGGQSEAYDHLRELTALHAEGILSHEEFQELRAECIAAIREEWR